MLPARLSRYVITSYSIHYTKLYEVPNSEEYRGYLGLKQNPGETFTLNDIDADVLLIELFSMYCPFCQEEAENVNALFETMYDFSKPEFSVKIIGLA